MARRLLRRVLPVRTPKVPHVAGVGRARTASVFSMTELPTGSGGVCLCLYGEVDLCCRDSLRNRILAIIGIDQVKHLVVDLDQVEFLDCSGIGVLVNGRAVADAVGCRYEVHNPRGYVASVLVTAGVWALLVVDAVPASKVEA
jgi:anti-anti-sigma factor